MLHFRSLSYVVWLNQILHTESAREWFNKKSLSHRCVLNAKLVQCIINAPVLETKAGPSVQDRQLLVKTSNFLHISLQINVWISQNSDQDPQLFQLSPEHCNALIHGLVQLKTFLAATKQLYEWFSPSVRPSVRPSVCHTFLTMFPSSYHHEIFRSYYQWQKWRPCKRSRSEVKGQGHRGHNPTLPFPDCNSSLNSRMMMKWCI